MANLIRYQDPELSTWTPFDRLSSARDEMNRLFDWSFRNFLGGGETGLFSGWSPAVDIFQDKDNIYVKSELPGMKKEEIDISLHEGMLTISGERKREEEFKEGDTFRSERFFQLLLASEAIKRSLPGLNRKRQQAIERTQNRQQEKQFAIGISHGD